MPLVAKRSSKAAEQSSPLPRWIPSQLTQLTKTAPSGPQWLHEIKLDGFRMAARIDRGGLNCSHGRGSTGPKNIGAWLPR